MYARRFDDEILEFGVLGVEKGTPIMYDAQTSSQWSQLFGRATVGKLEGKSLEKLPSTMTTWKTWRALHPDTTVYVKRSTPYDRRFTRESFADIAGGGDGPVQAQDLIVGLEGHVEARAYLLRRLAGERLAEDRFEGAPILVYLSEDLATARVFQRKAAGRELTFRIDGDALVDAETGSRWNPLTGAALEGPMQGQQMQPLVSTYSLWFAWKKYRPDTVLHGEPEAAAAAGG